MSSDRYLYGKFEFYGKRKFLKKASQGGENKERSKEKPKHEASNAPIPEFQEEEDTYTENMSLF